MKINIFIPFLIVVAIIACTESSNNLTSTEKHINLITPNGGEIFFIGDSINIRWESKNVDQMKINISMDDGQSWNVLSEDLLEVREYIFVITDTSVSENCLIKVEDKNDNQIFDISDESFSIMQDAINQEDTSTHTKAEIRIFTELATLYTNKSPLFFNYESNYLISYANSKTNIWDINSGQLFKSIPISLLSTSPSENLIIGFNNSKDSVSIWDIKSGEKIEEFSTWYPFDAKMSTDGQYIAIARTRWIDIWNVETKEHIQNITVRNSPSEDNFHTVEFSPDNQIIASANDKLRLYDVETGAKIQELNRAQAFSIKFTSDGERIIAGGVSGIVNSWNIQTGEMSLEFSADNERVFSIDISQDNNKLIVGTKGELLVWDLVANIQDTVIYNSGTSNYLGVAYSKDSKYVAGKASSSIVLYGPMN